MLMVPILVKVSLVIVKDTHGFSAVITQPEAGLNRGSPARTPVVVCEICSTVPFGGGN